MKPSLKSVPTIESVTLALVLAKDEEQQAHDRRVALEEQLAALMPCAVLEGTRQEIVGDYRVSIRYGVTRKVDSDKLQALWATLPEPAQGAFRWKADVALPKLRALQELQPQTYALLVDTLGFDFIDLVEPEAA